jgi:hypothetical protein
MKKEQLAENSFINLLGKEKIDEIKNCNWVKFDCDFLEISKGKYDYVDYQFAMKFLEKDNKGDTVIFCSIHYNAKTEKWWSENSIDYPYIKYDTFEEMINHYHDIEDDIINNNFNLIEI